MDSQAGTEVRTFFADGPLSAVAICDTEQRVAVAGNYKSVSIFSIVSGFLERRLGLGIFVPVCCLESQSTNAIAWTSTGLVAGGYDSTITSWDWAEEERINGDLGRGSPCSLMARLQVPAAARATANPR